MTLFQQANKAFCSKDYATSLKLYEQAIQENPEFGELYAFNMDLARSRLKTPPFLVTQSSPCDLENFTPPNYSSAKDLPKSGLFFPDLYDLVNKITGPVPAVPLKTAPLVSVLMTSHNVADYVESAVTSVLRQSWPRLELIVIDDASEDDTWDILRRMEQTAPNLVCRRLNTNLGTYFAKNYALTLSKGDFIFFQDADDLSHPDRISICMEKLRQPNVLCVRSAYSRVEHHSGRVLPVNGVIYRLGLITLGVRRDIFDAIGMFNCTNKAADNEFFDRIQAWSSLNEGEIHDINLPLYYNTLRDNSLFQDMIANSPREDGYIEQRPSLSRRKYVEAYRTLHATLEPEKFKEHFRFPVLRDIIPVEKDMTSLPNPKHKVVACLCSIPERTDSLQKTMQSLDNQVDKFHLYLDRYDGIPDFVYSFCSKVEVVLSKDKPGLRDNGKFYPFTSITYPCYYLTVDDDIIYPPDYAITLINKIERYHRQAVIGVHGILLPEKAEQYFGGYRKVLFFSKELRHDQLVNAIGTGAAAFHSDLLKGMDLRHFPTPGMADLHLAAFCKKRGIPMVAIARPDAWIQEQPTHNATLFDEFRSNDSVQADIIRKHRPWGYAAILDAVAHVADTALQQRFKELLPVLRACLS